MSVNANNALRGKGDEMSDFRDELRQRRPGRALKADHGNSARNAILLHCEECAGSLGEAEKCPAMKCFLYPYRPRATARPDGVVPTAEEYEAMRPEIAPAAAAALAAYRNGGE